jgi:hypothetical protein
MSSRAKARLFGIVEETDDKKKRKQKKDRATLIKEELQGWAVSADEYVLYELWVTDRILHYAGGWLDQPLRIHELFRKCALADELETINHKRPSTANVPSFDTIAGG